MTLTFWQIVILAVVQGITEFLPISSDGHLVVVAEYFRQQGANPEVSSVVIALHMGTLLSILVFYWRRILDLLTKDQQVIPLIIVATIPAVIFGLTMKIFFEPLLENTLLAGFMLPVTGMLLIWGERQPLGDIDYRQLSWWKAFVIGCAQATAILPGLSRSGSTISTSLALRLKRESAATFSFLMAIPAIAGAGVLECLKMWKKGDFTAGVDPVNLGAGIFISFVVGLAAIWVLVRLLERGRLRYFGYYCIALGLLVIAWQLYASPSTKQASPGEDNARASLMNITRE